MSLTAVLRTIEYSLRVMVIRPPARCPMAVLLWFVLFLLGGCIVLLFPFLLLRELYHHYRGSRAVACPENHQLVSVALDARRASLTALAGRPVLRVAECTRWPERASCDGACAPVAEQTRSFVAAEFAGPRTKVIYHLPVLLAAFSAWVLGAAWHSHYLFRARWMGGLGWSRSDVHQMVWQFAPHLLSLAIPLLFAYGVAWLLAITKIQGLQAGVVMGVLLWAAIVGASLVSTNVLGLATDLLRIELGYTFLASVTIGAIVGGLNGKLVEGTFAE